MFCSRSCAGKHQWNGHTRTTHNWGKRPSLGNDHQKLRKAMLPEAIGKRCPIRGCTTVITTANADLDHIVARADGGKTTRDNCRIICRPCNRKRGSSLGGFNAKARRNGHRAGTATPHATAGQVTGQQSWTSRTW